MRGYGQYCPIARGAEVFGTRWTPIIVRNLLMGCETFGEILDGAPGLPRTLLSQRLRELESVGVLRRVPNPGRRGWRYELTPAGHSLAPVCDALGAWGEQWLELAPQHVDPYVVVWGIARTLQQRPDLLPPRRVTVLFDIAEQRLATRRLWLVAAAPEPEVCVSHPGWDEDLVVTTDAAWLAGWRLGRWSIGSGLRAERVRADGPRALIRTLQRWGEVGRTFGGG